MSYLFTCLPKTGYRLRISLCFLLVLLLQPLSGLRAQTLRFTFKNQPLTEVMSKISAQTGYQFVYDAAFVSKASPITFSVKSATLKQVLDQMVKGQSFSYQLKDKTIILISGRSPSKEFRVHGMVVDSAGIPLPGAAIKIKNTGTFVKSDANGHFSVPLSSANNSVEVSFVGFLSENLVWNESDAEKVQNIKLQANSSLLSEIIVTGYQTISKERSTASAVIVDNKKLNENLNVDLISALEGRVPGLMYQKNVTGSDVDKPILRGIGVLSPTASVTPLIVVDGLPSETTLDQINPYDVESVTVLKDAAANSIYGTRAGNGVIVVTTKKGTGPVKINVNTDYFLTSKPSFESLHLASTSDLIDFETAVYNRERARYATTETMFAAYTNKYYSPLYQLYRDRDAGKLTADQVSSTLNSWRNNDFMQDYSDNIWQNEVRKRYNLSLSTAGLRSNMFTSINFDQSDERVKGNANKNLNLYFKNAFSPKKWLNLTLGFNGTYAKSTVTDAEYNSYTIQPRYAQIKDDNGNLVYADYVDLDDGFTTGGSLNGASAASINANAAYKSTKFNLLESLEEGRTDLTKLNLRAFTNVQVNLLKTLKFNSQVQYEIGQTKEKNFFDATSYKMRYASNVMTSYNTTTAKYEYAIPTGGRFYQTSYGRSSYTFRNQLTYDEKISKDHSITALGGFEMIESFVPVRMQDLRYGYDPVTLTYTSINSNLLSQTGVTSSIFGSGKTLSTGISAKQDELERRYYSVFANGSYTYLGKYNLTGSIRLDKASLFGLETRKKGKPFWSVGLGWNASNESFLSDVSWLTLLKLRTTYGINGNVSHDSQALLIASRRNDVLYPALQYFNITLPNPKLRWEKVKTANIGLDFALFSNRLRGNLDIYDKTSVDLLTSVELDPTVGASSLTLNSGSLNNKGIELSLGGDWLKNSPLQLTTQFIIGSNRTVVKKVTIAASTAPNYVASPTNYYELETTYNSLYAYRYGGMVNGYPYFLDENGNPTVQFDANGNPISSSIKSISNMAALDRMGSLTPTWNGSVSQRISYKRFELGALLVFSGGNVMRRDVTSLSSDFVTDQNIVSRYTDANQTDLPRLKVDYAENLINNASTISSLWEKANIHVIKGDYVKLRNLSLAYTLPQRYGKIIGLSNVKLTAQANNLWYKSAAGDDIDPEVYNANSGTRNIEIPKSFLFGLNLSL